jgi:hypothetical protein
MAKANTKTYSIHTLIALITMFIPLLVGIYKYTTRENKDDISYNKPNLPGLVINDKAPKLSIKTWFSGEYQSEREDYNNDHWAFKEKMVRANNEFYYSAFNQLRVNQFVSGKENYVFAEAAIQSHYGNDFIGEKNIKEYIRKCKVLQDTLAKKGVSLILCYAPGKGIGASKYIEDKYKQPIKKTNYEVLAAESKRQNINHIDLVSYFHKIKDTCRYPLYARFAHHWTNYFDCLASKEIITYIENLRKVNLPDITWGSIELSDTARSRDNDVARSMNLLKLPPQAQPLAYYKYDFNDSITPNNTRVLTVGDSYWYGIVFMRVPQYCFAGGEFWYYNNKVVPSRVAGEKIEAWQLDLKESIESNEAILVMGSDPAFPKLGWGFIEDAYELYTSPKTYKARYEKEFQLKTFSKQIRESPTLLKKSTRLSEQLQISLDSAIKLDALKLTQ